MAHSKGLAALRRGIRACRPYTEMDNLTRNNLSLITQRALKEPQSKAPDARPLLSRQGLGQWRGRMLGSVACCVSLVEEPDAGNLHVRFCEGLRSNRHNGENIVAPSGNQTETEKTNLRLQPGRPQSTRPIYRTAGVSPASPHPKCAKRTQLQKHTERRGGN